MDLNLLRAEISQIDAECSHLLQQRQEIAEKIGTYKKDHGGKIVDTVREKEILLEKISHFPEDPEGITSLWREIMYLSKRIQYKIFQKDIVIGIQGGKGSFNERAIEGFLSSPEGKALFPARPSISYLYTTEAVLEALNNGEIQYGQFALANSIGGIVEETITCLGNYRWKKQAIYDISVQHSLLIHKDAKKEDITTIMGHEQAIRQCEKTLSRLFPHAKLVGGTGDLTDNASIAEAVANGSLSKQVGSVGHISLTALYNLQCISENVHDRNDNRTTFLCVTRS